MPSRSTSSTAASATSDPGIQKYYRLHAGIYDATRWSFLFGRSLILERAAALHPAPERILEIGCGTGRNLLELARRFPRAQITGIDLSDSMLAVAGRKTAKLAPRIDLVQRAYAEPLSPRRGYDLVLCSYALSMFNPGLEAALAAIQRDLAPGGHLAFVDFHHTRHAWFARWMGINHVRIDGHLRTRLCAGFPSVINEMRPAYGGLWEYLLYVGQRREQAVGPANRAGDF